MLEWLNPGKEISEEQIIEVENIINFRFPYPFKKVLRFNNGGIPKKDAFEFWDESLKKNTRSGIGQFIPLLSTAYNSIVSLLKSPPEFFPANLVPFAEVGNGDLICFDYAKNEFNPPIVYWHHEYDEGEDVSFVAEDFNAFLNILKISEEI